MYRSLGVDLLACIVPVSIGFLALLGGYRQQRHGEPRFLVRVTLLLLAVLAAIRVTPFYDAASPTFFALGGMGRLAAWLAYVLVGMVWAAPQRTWSTGFTVFLTVFLAALIVAGSGGRLVWRCAGNELWGRSPNESGTMTQSSSMACGAASAVMLLHRYEIAAGEGEMAYRSDTSLLGVDLHGLAAALNAKASDSGMVTVVQRSSYQEATAWQTPFIAEMSVLVIKSHAIFVERLDEDHAVAIDPWLGYRQLMPRADFARSWTGRSVRMVIPTPASR